MSDPLYYETMYILRPDIPEEEVESHLTKYSDLLKKADVKVLDSQMRGKRRLAYPIGKDKEGIYVQLSHQGDGKHIEVLERAMRLSEDVIRYLTVKQEGPLPTPKHSPSTNKDSDSESKSSDKEAKDSESKSEDKDSKEEVENKSVEKESKEPESKSEDKATKEPESKSEDKTTKESEKKTEE